MSLKQVSYIYFRFTNIPPSWFHSILSFYEHSCFVSTELVYFLFLFIGTLQHKLDRNSFRKIIDLERQEGCLAFFLFAPLRKASHSAAVILLQGKIKAI